MGSIDYDWEEQRRIAIESTRGTPEYFAKLERVVLGLAEEVGEFESARDVQIQIHEGNMIEPLPREGDVATSIWTLYSRRQLKKTNQGTIAHYVEQDH